MTTHRPIKASIARDFGLSLNEARDGSLPSKSRRQATLYLPADQSAPIELLRERFNPIQAALIRSHVTLCREDEVANWGDLAARLDLLKPIEVSLRFETPVREGNSVLIPASGTTVSFDALRAALLSKNDVIPRKLSPHITIVHPRNGTCDEEQFDEICRSITPLSILFRSVTMIEQIDGGVWRDLASFN